ncbi:MAG: hypothetical protein IPM96_10250 [Ignavibacteria bacterium]|nr:hypothetical protein [Ignavibacteria bacterium]
MERNMQELLNGLLRTIIRTLENLVWPTREIDEVNYLRNRTVSSKLDGRRWINRFGFDEAVKLCEENNRRPVMTLRVNNLKVSTAEFENFLKEKNLFYKKGKYLDNFFSTKSMSKLFTEEVFKQDFFPFRMKAPDLYRNFWIQKR